MPTILVTGGAGFIGSRFVNLVLSNKLPDFQNWNVVVLDALTYSSDIKRITPDEATTSRLSIVHGDIGDKELLTKLINRSDGIINFAAETHVDRSIDSPDIFFQSNFHGVANILNILRTSNKRFLQISTDEVYGSIKNGYAKEDSILSPSSPYSASKASADLIALSYFKTFELDVVITRCSNNYGPNQFPEKIIPLFIKELKKGNNVPIYGDGKNSRDWIHVDDHCDAIALTFFYGLSGEIYNVGNIDHINNLELTFIILENLNLPRSRITFTKDRLGHDLRYAIDSEKIRKGLGWNPKKRLVEEMPKLIAHY